MVQSPDDFDAREETIAVLTDGDLMQQFVSSEMDVAAGRVESVEELTAAMQRRRTA